MAARSPGCCRWDNYRPYTARPAPIPPAGRRPCSNRAVVEDPFLQSRRGLPSSVGESAGRRVEGGGAVAFVGDVKRLGIGKPHAERKRRGAFGCRRQALEDAHVVGEHAFGLQHGGVVGDRRGRQRRQRSRNTDAVRAGERRAGGIEARRVDEVDGIDAVAAAALGHIDDVVEDGEAAEVCVLADLVRLQTELGDAEASDRCRIARGLVDQRRYGRAS